MTTFRGTTGADRLIGADDQTDVFKFQVGELSSADIVVGGDGLGADRLTLLDTGAIDLSVAGPGLSGLEVLVLSDAGNAITLAGSGATFSRVVGGDGNDSIDARHVAADDILEVTPGAGKDVIIGHLGSDIISVAPGNLTASDVIVGDDGFDTLRLTAAGTVTPNAFANLSGIEALRVAANGIQIKVSNALATNNGGAIVQILSESRRVSVDVDASAQGIGTVSVQLSPGGSPTDDRIVGPGSGGTLIVTADADALSAGDQLIGGAGIERLVFTSSGAIDAARFTGVTGFGHIMLASTGNHLALNDAVVAPNANVATLAHFGTVATGLLVDGGDGDDEVDGSAIAGNSSVLVDNAGAGNDRLAGGAGIDFLHGGVGADIIVGGGGDDVLDGGSGRDVMTGGTGNDRYLVDSSFDQIIESAGNGIDQVISTASFRLSVEIEHLVLSGSAIKGIGNDLDNTLTGNTAANLLDGQSGDDRIDGGLGADLMRGGAGNDTYVVDDIADTVAESRNRGIDSVLSSVSFTLGAHVENLTLTGPSAIDGTGNDLANILLGNDAANLLQGGGGDDSIDGGGGADIMQGGAGDDRYRVGRSSDQVLEAADEGVDTIESAVSLALGRNIENLVLLGNKSLRGSGNEASNIIVGNDGDNKLLGLDGDDLLDGGAGEDILRGGFGNDVYIVDTAFDRVLEGRDAGHDTVRSTQNHQLSANVEDLVLIGDGNISGTGNALNNRITGNKGYNFLEGDDGDDLLQGGDGGDTLQGGIGDDTLEGGNGNDILNGGFYGEGRDVMRGGVGDDTYYVDHTEDQVIDGMGEGIFDTIYISTISHYRLSADQEIEHVVLTYTDESSAELIGNDFSQTLEVQALASTTLKGNGGNDILRGFFADDFLDGGKGNDILDGGAGNDIMHGGRGNDVYFVDSDGDVVSESRGNGVDHVHASISYTLGDGLEDLTLETFAVGLTATGNDLNNRITGSGAGYQLLIGNAGSDILDGQGGSGGDTMNGGEGDDIFVVRNAGEDIILEVVGEGDDLVDLADDSGAFTLGAGVSVETITLRPTLGGTHSVSGNELDNTLNGNSRGNHLNGGGGNDVLRGGGGNDMLFGGDGDDRIEADDKSWIDGGAGTDSVTLRPGSRLDLTQIAGIANVEAVDLHGGGGETLILDSTVGNDFLGGIIRVFGDAGDHIDVADRERWVDGGMAFLDGVAVHRFIGGSTTLYADAPITVTETSSAVGTEVITDGFARQVVNATTLSPTRGFVIHGNPEQDFRFWLVSEAGDVNGDGFSDVMIGTDRGDDGGFNAGEAYVVFGSGDAVGRLVDNGAADRRQIDIDRLTATQGFVIQGDAALDRAATSIASAGDINGDGFDDLILSAPGGDDFADYAGEVYVVFGAAGGFGTTVNNGSSNRQVVDLTNLSPAQGFILDGPFAGARAGGSIAPAGDVNGDGFDDLMVGSLFSSTGLTYVLFGKPEEFGTAVTRGGATRNVMNLNDIGPQDGFIARTGAPGYVVVSDAGDVNGDGLDDMIFGDAGVAGDAIIVFGRSDGFGRTITEDGVTHQVLTLKRIPADQGVIIRDSEDRSYAGRSVAAAGDINGDGFDDVVIGASKSDHGGYDAGSAYVVFGRADGFGTPIAGRQEIDLASLSADQGFLVQGDASGDRAGLSVSSAGDVNGDGLLDIIVGAPHGQDGGGLTGEAYVVFGSSNGFGAPVTIDSITRHVVDLTSLAGSQGFIIQGGIQDGFVNSETGQSVSAAGDVNGDGFDDLIVSTTDFGLSSFLENRGEALVIFGGPAGFTLPQVAGTAGDDDLIGTAASERLIGGRGNDFLVGQGGTDVYVGGAGDDVIDIGSGSFFRVDGGTGSDTLRLVGNLDFTALPDTAIRNIEAIDVTGGGAQHLSLAARDVRALGATNHDVLGTGFDNVLIVHGDGDDSLHLADFGAAVSSASFGGTDYHVYQAGSTILAVETALTLV